MAFGFVLEKFSLFVQQMKIFANQANFEHTFPKDSGMSALTGFILVIFGALTTVLAYVKFRLTSRQIESDNYKPLYLFDLTITIAVLIVAVFLIIYLSPD
jgi:putative membrane protein